MALDALGLGFHNHFGISVLISAKKKKNPVKILTIYFTKNISKLLIISEKVWVPCLISAGN